MAPAGQPSQTIERGVYPTGGRRTGTDYVRLLLQRGSLPYGPYILCEPLSRLVTRQQNAHVAN